MDKSIDIVVKSTLEELEDIKKYALLTVKYSKMHLDIARAQNILDSVGRAKILLCRILE